MWWMTMFSLHRTSDHLQHTDTSGSTWGKGTDQMFHPQHATPRPHCELLSSPSSDSAQTGLQLLSGRLLLSHGLCDSIRLSKHSPIMHNALMSYDLFNKWNCISNHLFPLYEWTGIRHGRLTALISHLMHAYALLPQIQLGFTTLRWTVSSPGQFLIHYSHCACVCVFVAVCMEVHR